MTEIIKEKAELTAAPSQVYEALTDAGKFSAFTSGAKAEIDARPGGAVSLFSGMIKGFMLGMAPGRTVVQAWRSEGWEPNVFSIVRFDLEPMAKGTRITVTQSGQPDGTESHLRSGWHKNYLEPLAKAFN